MATEMAGKKYIANPAELPRGTLVDLFFDAVRRWGERPAYRPLTASGLRDISYREFAAEVHRLARALSRLGVQRGDRVALLAENRPEWPMADMAVLCLGAAVVPVYPTLPPNQIVFILQHSQARLLFVSSVEQLEKIRQIRQELPALEKIVVFDEATPRDGDALTLSTLLSQAEPAGREPEPFAAFEQRSRAARPEDVATIIYTSGTTGEPKGVMLSHNNLFSNIEAGLRVLPISSADVALSFATLSHVLERMVDYAYFRSGCVVSHVADLNAIMDTMAAVRPTIFASVPRIYEKVYDRVMSASGAKGVLVSWARQVGLSRAEALLAGERPPMMTRLQFRAADRLVFRKLRARLGGRGRYFISGGAPLEPRIAKFFYAAGITILEGYGLTETSPVTNVNSPTALRFGTVGRPVPGTEEMIAEDGEILVRGPQVMKGYYENPDATRDAIDAEGWFHTGDIGEIDADGFLRITDRKKDLIVTAGGKNVAPQPIENRVKTNRFVGEAVMIGDRRPYPILLIVPSFEALEDWAAGQGIDARDRSALVRDSRVQQKMEQEVFTVVREFARFEQPKKIVLLDAEFTVEGGVLTPSLKVKRRVVYDRYRELIEAVYGLDRSASVVVPE